MAKGGSFELEVGRDLSLLWSGGKRPDLCRRTEMSGGRLTARSKKSNKLTKFQGGDLTFSDPSIKPFFEVFSVECKTGYTSNGKQKPWDALDFLDSRQKKPQLVQFWEQAVGDADKSKRIPLLVFRRNNRKAVVVMRKETYGRFSGYYGDVLPSISLVFDSEKLVLIRWADFINWIDGIDPAVLKKLFLS